MSYSNYGRRKRRKPVSSPVIDYILSVVPTYPGMILVETVRKQIQFHPDQRLRLSSASEPVSLYSRFSTLVRRHRLIRVGMGLYSKPRNAQDLGFKWRPVKHSKPTMSQELRTANALIREQLGAEPKKRNEKRNLFAPPVVKLPQEIAPIDIFA